MPKGMGMSMYIFYFFITDFRGFILLCHFTNFGIRARRFTQEVGNEKEEFGLNSKSNMKPLKCFRRDIELINLNFRKI